MPSNRPLKRAAVTAVATAIAAMVGLLCIAMLVVVGGASAVGLCRGTARTRGGASAASTAASSAGAAVVTTGPCMAVGGTGVLPVTGGPRATLLPDGEAAAPADAPAAVKAIIAAGNQIAGKPYVYGGGHGLSLSEIAPSYDCSSSVDHLLYGGGLLPASADLTSGLLESWGRPGPGRWVTIYANADHVFMYVAGMRWDTYAAAGPGDGSNGIGWHPLVRDATGFVVRHPVGL